MAHSKTLRHISSTLVATTAMLVLSVALFAAGPADTPQQNLSKLERDIRHELVMLPYYTVFDNLQFQVKGDDTVVLSGQVVWGPLKDHAEEAVENVKGITGIVNNIEVLPLYPYDNALRYRLYRAIYGQAGFTKYSDQTVPPIHIIVDNGRVTLIGVVNSQFDKNAAGIAANTVRNVQKVTNDLQVERNA